MCRIAFQRIAETNWRATLALTVHPEQQRFVADAVPIAAIVLAKAFIRPGGKTWQPYAIYAEDLLIGLITLAYAEPSADEYWIYHFFIDHRYQGQGYGRQALTAFLHFLGKQYSTCRVIQLTVHPENRIAQRLYTAAGFQSTGEECAGEPIYRYQMPDTM